MKKAAAVAATASTAIGILVARQSAARLRAERFGAATLETLLNAIDANDAITGAHVRRVAAYSLILAEAAGLDARTSMSIERVALFHDIGKLDEALSDIFHDSQKLSPAERRAVMTHPQRGADVLEPLAKFYPDLRRGVLAHHERWDGSGYPKGLKGKKIPLPARVVAIADSFDAITHRRRYSHGRSLSIATEAIAEGRATQFDPELVDLFLSPLVIDCVALAMKAALVPGRKPEQRRRHQKQERAPDIKFRWREPLKELKSRDRARRSAS